MQKIIVVNKRTNKVVFIVRCPDEACYYEYETLKKEYPNCRVYVDNGD